ncbi:MULTISPECIES: hypothetical protein [unclassified Streptomyces]
MTRRARKPGTCRQGEVPAELDGQAAPSMFLGLLAIALGMASIRPGWTLP